MVSAIFMPGSFDQERILFVNDLLTVQEVADILRVDATTVRRWIKSGALEAVALSHQNIRVAYRVKCETVENLLSESSSQN
jgi:excisionase family DNA binding protein